MSLKKLILIKISERNRCMTESILDSFGLDLPVLDCSLVESVFRELEDENLPSSNDRAQITGKERYFQEKKRHHEGARSSRKFS